MEIITPAQYGEYDAFVASHPQSSFTQCTDWRKVKNNWGYEAVDVYKRQVFDPLLIQQGQGAVGGPQFVACDQLGGDALNLHRCV